MFSKLPNQEPWSPFYKTDQPHMNITPDTKKSLAPLAAIWQSAGNVVHLELPDSAGQHVSSKTQGPPPLMQGDGGAANTILPHPRTLATVGTGVCNKQTVAPLPLSPPPTYMKIRRRKDRQKP